MILQALNDYYLRKCNDPDPAKRLPDFGMEQKEIPFLLEITKEGELVQLLDTRSMSGKKKQAQIFRVPQGVKKTSGVSANLLWDTLEYVLGVDTKGKPERVAEQHAQFVARIQALPASALNDVGIQAVLNFLRKVKRSEIEKQSNWMEALADNAVMTFRLKDENDLVCQRTAVVKAVLGVVTDEDDKLAMCLVTGISAPVQRLHTAIKGVWGAQSSGANIVSFNARAFESYGKTERQGENAPVSKTAAFAYTTALNHLLRKDSNQRIQVGDASTVFWAERDSVFETTLPNIFGESPKDDPDKGVRSVRALFEAAQSGKLAGPEGENRFHILGLSPNAARISIRFYHCLPMHELGTRLIQYFKDIDIVRSASEPQYPSLFRLLIAVAVQNKADNIPPNLGGAIVDAIFGGPDTPFPSLWLNAAVRRCRAEQKPTFMRAAAIKACLNRQIRRSYITQNSQPLEKEFLTMLDTSNPNPAYRMGRLFATLEKIQQEASPGINSTIRDRYYGAASSTPVTVFTTLLRLKNSHLKKLSVGRGIWFERLLGDILSTVADYPKNLSLPDQGRFALGYYHQREDLFQKKLTDTTTIKEGHHS